MPIQNPNNVCTKQDLADFYTKIRPYLAGFSSDNGGGGSDTLAGLNDVSLSTLSDGEVLKYSAAESKWVNGEGGGSGGAGGSKITVTTLSEDLIGATVTISDGVSSFTGTMSSSKSCVIDGVTITGTLSVVARTGQNIAQGEIEVPYYGAYSIEINTQIIYGFHVDSTNSNPSTCVSYELKYNGIKVANYDYSPAYMNFSTGKWVWGDWSEDVFFMPRPCLVKQDYSEIIYLNPNNYTKDIDDNDVSDKLTGSTDGYNAMVEWGKDGKQIWYKLVPDESDSTSYTVYISDKQADEGFVAWPFYDQNGNLSEHFYTSIYEACNVNKVLRSLSGKTSSTDGGSSQVSYAAANNKNSESYAWYIDIYADRVLINFLTVLLIKSLNSDVIGTGYYSSINDTTGAGNLNGPFYGIQGNGVVKVFHMENTFGNSLCRVAGASLSSYVFRYKLTHSTADGSTGVGYREASGDTAGYLTSTTINNTNNSYIIKETAKTDGSLFPSVYNGYNGQYYSDGLTAYTGLNGVYWGGASGQGTTCGMWRICADDPFNRQHNLYRTRLSLKPVASVSE